MGQGASSAFDSCHKILATQVQTELAPEDVPMMQDAPKLGLRVFANPCSESDCGALCAAFLGLGCEIIATELEKVKGWDALRTRYERSAKERAGVLYTKGPTATQTSAQTKLQWPEGYRFNAARRFWRAKVICQDGQGGFQEHHCMLVVANAAEDRTQANVELDLQDSKDVASYASRFNGQLLKMCAPMQADCVPQVHVCAPVGCEVIKSSNQQFAGPGQAVMLIPYPFPEVKKFLFDGSEDFLEIPQAFFHHAAWLSNSHEYVCDLQGVENEEGGVILVDPCVLRAPRPNVGNLLSTLAAGKSQKENVPQAGDTSSDRFDALHPRCSQLCKAFDPHRRSATKRHCGLNISCGV